MTVAVVEPKPLATRGTSNANRRGSAESRRKRKQWLLVTYAADRTLTRVEWASGRVEIDSFVIEARLLLAFPAIVSAEDVPTCRCYRCGALLHYDTLTVDRIIPECEGGTYARTNIRPACADCNSETGGALANAKAHRKAKQSLTAARQRPCTYCGADRRKPCLNSYGMAVPYVHAARRKNS